MITLFCFLSGFLLLGLAGGTKWFDHFVLLVMIFVSVGFLFDLGFNKRLQVARNALVLGYFARILLLLYDVYSSDPLHLPLVGGPMTEDPMRFFNAALSFAQGEMPTYGGAFSKLFGIIFYLTAPSRLWGEFIVMLFSILTLLTIARIVIDLDISDRDKSLSIYFASLIPNYMLLSVIFRRETIITFFIALSLMFFLKWFKSVNPEKSFVLSIAFGLLASLFHGAVGIIVVFFLIVHFLYSPKDKSFKLTIKNIVFVFSFSLFFCFCCARYGTVFFTKLERLEAGNLEGLSSVRDAGGSSYARYVGNSSSLGNILVYSIPRFAYFTYSPFPWQWRGLNDILTFLMSSLPYFLILIKTIRSIRMHPKNSQARILMVIILFVTVGMMFVFSWGVTNTGTATRHRDKFIAMHTLLFAMSRGNRIRLNPRNKY